MTITVMSQLKMILLSSSGVKEGGHYVFIKEILDLYLLVLSCIPAETE